MSDKYSCDLKIKNFQYCKEIQCNIGKFVSIDAVYINTTNLSTQNATITNLNLNNTSITNLYLSQTILSDIPYVRYNTMTKQLLYKSNHFGEFISTMNQTAYKNSSIVLTYNLSYTHGINTNNTIQSQIVFTQPGTYKIGTSIQFDRTTGSLGTKAQCYFWFRKNGNDISNTATSVYLTAKSEIQCGYAEIIHFFNASEYIEVAMGGDEDIDAHYASASSSPSLIKPAIPSVITTVYQIG